MTTKLLMQEQQDKMTQIILDHYGYIYCNNCCNEGTDNCDECNRRAMNWQPSKFSAERLLVKIWRAFNDN